MKQLLCALVLLTACASHDDHPANGEPERDLAAERAAEGAAAKARAAAAQAQTEAKAAADETARLGKLVGDNEAEIRAAQDAVVKLYTSVSRVQAAARSPGSVPIDQRCLDNPLAGDCQ